MNGEITLDESTAEAFLELVLACAKGCLDAEAFRSLVRKYVKPLLPHRVSIAVLGSLSFDQLSIRHIVGTDCPENFLTSIPKQTKLQDRPVIAKWLATREPMVIDPARDRMLLSPLEAREIDTYGLGCLAVHGQIDLSSNMASYFSFAGVDDDASQEKIKFMLQLISPHLHAALISLPFMSMEEPILHRLTSLERELLTWLAAGRSNAEIAAIRKRSVATIRNQLSTLFRKINVSSRAEAVAVTSLGRFSLLNLQK